MSTLLFAWKVRDRSLLRLISALVRIIAQTFAHCAPPDF
jgi:hypothetical protein